MSISGLFVIVVIGPLIGLALWLLSRWVSKAQGTDAAERKRIMEMVEFW